MTDPTPAASEPHYPKFADPSTCRCGEPANHVSLRKPAASDDQTVTLYGDPRDEHWKPATSDDQLSPAEMDAVLQLARRAVKLGLVPFIILDRDAPLPKDGVGWVLRRVGS